MYIHFFFKFCFQSVSVKKLFSSHFNMTIKFYFSFSAQFLPQLLSNTCNMLTTYKHLSAIITFNPHKFLRTPIEAIESHEYYIKLKILLCLQAPKIRKIYIHLCTK